ncbi:type II secretion system minor pseudopilin GspI [Kineobactrum salinum]|uniref:type II secretion system minor pseudopilin GspI n=1 Tax=Kineobactrum salinum TaxID=2708301 RepID=UPI0018D9E60D|nr:type II secretion system minor pseudopilin GspI [Kineobactrum salinum]
MRTGSACRGFTLVEVMVALAIVALALPALMFSLQQQVDGTAYLRDKSLAQLIANNKLVELRLLTQARGSLFQGRDSGVAELAGRDWYWTLETATTEVQSFYRVEIAVREGDTDQRRPLYTLVGFMTSEGRTDDGA